MSLRIKKVSGFPGSQSSTYEHPDRRRKLLEAAAASAASDHSKGQSKNNSASSRSFKDILEISAEGRRKFEESKK
jgi:hypothetical protein